MVLTDRQKLVLTLREKCHVSQRDIAARLRISEPAVSQIIARAMDRVRGVLGNCQHIEQREAILALLN